MIVRGIALSMGNQKLIDEYRASATPLGLDESTPGQPFRLALMRHMARVAGHPDKSLFEDLHKGVKMGDVGGFADSGLWPDKEDPNYKADAKFEQ